MTTIDPAGRLLAQIRAQALAYKRPGARPEPGAAAADESLAPEAPRDWAADVAQAVLALEPGDPDRRRKAFRAYLQAVLARECGFRQLDEPGFQDLVDRVEETMQRDPLLREAMLRAGELVLRSAGR